MGTSVKKNGQEVRVTWCHTSPRRSQGMSSPPTESFVGRHKVYLRMVSRRPGSCLRNRSVSSRYTLFLRRLEPQLRNWVKDLTVRSRSTYHGDYVKRVDILPLLLWRMKRLQFTVRFVSRFYLTNCCTIPIKDDKTSIPCEEKSRVMEPITSCLLLVRVTKGDL